MAHFFVVTNGLSVYQAAHFFVITTCIFGSLLCYQTQTSYSNDRGKDGIAYKDNKKYLIECKRYEKDKRIGRPQLQKFFAAIYEENAIKGFFVSTAIYTDTAYEYAKGNKIELINGAKLVELMRKAYPEDNDDIFNVMCLQCGDIVSFDMDKPEITKTYCKNGHIVESNITYLDLFSNHIRTRRYRRR